MSDEDNPLRAKFGAAIDREMEADRWPIRPIGDSDFERGCRAGIEVVLATIREQNSGMNIQLEDDGRFLIGIVLTETLEYEEDLEEVIEMLRDMHTGDDEKIRTISAFFRRMADKVDKAIGQRLRFRDEDEVAATPQEVLALGPL